MDFVAGGTDNRFVVDNVGDFQVEHATLLQALEVAGSSQAQVGFGDGKAVGGAAHGLDALLAVAA